tara:strand:- start:163 stop:606 length:444 start_codon:yes stop_codon:yes gene_type:complete
MAAYTQEQLNSGSLGEVLNAGTTYTFTFTTPAFLSQSVYGGNAYFSMDSAAGGVGQSSSLSSSLQPADLGGTIGGFTGDVSQSLFVSSSYTASGAIGQEPPIWTYSFPIRQNVGSGNGAFTLNPTTTVPANSYYLKSTGHMTLNITS